MNEQEEFLSPQQSKLINFAIWAKYLAWLFLGVNILLAGLILIQDISELNDLSTIYRFLDSTNIILDILPTIMRGAISFLTLKGISLGLYMIVETDINYREQKHGEKHE